MREIPLHGAKAAGRHALVDEADFALVSQYRWRVFERLKEGRRPNGPYAVTSLWQHGRQSGLSMHALITGWPLVDHLNHDGLDNQRANLRPATDAENRRNSRPAIGSSSRYKGVTWHKGVRKWQAAIMVGAKSHYLGCFASETDAALAYNAAALQFFGSRAFLNEVAR
jgi:hypothetical protein